jgi:diguanylate cyclase (GGDEF)-like protein
MVEDLGLTNGSYVNDVPVQRSVLRDNDYLKIGAAIFKFLSGVGVEASYYEEIYRMTIIDGLTGAHNKRYFLEFVEREAARCARHKRPLSLLMFDIDHFKKINDTYGHEAGDHVLQEMTRLVRSELIRPRDIFARYGGEEFAVLLPSTPGQRALDLAERLRTAVEAPAFVYEGTLLPVTCSVGVAALQIGIDSAAALLKAADMAGYESKRSGRNRVTMAH